MTKVKWIRFSTGLTAKQVVNGLKRLEYLPSGSDGFQIVRYREDFLEARYIERIEYEEVVKDPFGTEVVLNRLLYNQLEFSISFLSGILEVCNPPRSLVKFTTRLGEACGFNVSIDPVSLDLSRLGMVSGFVRDYFLEKTIVVSDLILTSGVKARVVAKGNEGVVEALSDVVGKRPHKISSISYSSKSIELRASFSLSMDGAIRVSGRDAVRVVKEVRDVLLEFGFM